LTKLVVDSFIYFAEDLKRRFKTVSFFAPSMDFKQTNNGDLTQHKRSKNQHPPVSRSIQDFTDAPVDWSKWNLVFMEKSPRVTGSDLRDPSKKEALQNEYHSKSF
jgi:hypothetical protein